MTSLIDLGRYVERTRHGGDTEPRSKRVRIAGTDLSSFQPGSVISVRLQDFVTYTLTEFNLSPSLNMIIGPNGSGKSTFVCAVCLGLAGKPEYIGRSKRVEDFIKNGQDVSRIEITLKNSPKVNDIENVNAHDETIKITRIITRSKRRSDYLINDCEVSESVVKALVAQLNIQLDNLCQFLSQERVEEFARLKSVKLLVETIRSIDSSLLDVLDELRELQGNEQCLQKDLDVKKSKILHLRQESDKLRKSVESLRDFQKKKGEIELHSRLLPYVKVKDHKEKLNVYKEEYERAKANLRAILKDKKPFAHTKKTLENRVEELTEKCSMKNHDFLKAKEKVNEIFEKLNTIRDDVIKKKSQNEYYRGRTKKLQANIISTKEDLLRNQEILGQTYLPENSVFEDIDITRKDIISKEGGIRDLISEIDAKANAINHEMRGIQRQAEGKTKSLTTTDKIGILNQDQDLKEVRDAVWMIRNDAEMKGKILEPPIMTVSAINPQFAAYLAQCVDYNTSKALTVVDSDSYRLFANSILEKFKVNLRELSDIDIKPPVPIEAVKDLGFEGYLSDFITGDKKVMKMLCQVNKIHTIPVSRRELTPAQIKKLITPTSNGKVLFKRIIHGNRLVDIKQSAYGTRQVFPTDVNIKQTNFYQGSIMSNEQKIRIENEISDLKNEYSNRKSTLDVLSTQKSAYRQELSELASRNDDINKKAHQLNEARKKYTMRKSTIETLEEKLDQLKREARKDVSQKIKDIDDQIQRLLLNQTHLLSKMVSSMNSLKNCQKELMSSQILHFEAHNMDVSMNDVIGFFNEREADLKRQYEDKKRFVKEMRDTPEFQSWMQEIRCYDEDTKEKLNEVAEKYEKDGNFNLSFVQDVLDKLESEIAMVNHDESAVTILDQVTTELRELEQTVPRQTKELEIIRAKLKENHAVLEPKLDDIVAKISTRFARLFNNVGSAGAVRLEKPKDYSEWKIEIMVKFRDNAPLKKLDSHTQSGGERAVSTVLYMIALQEFTSAPFRVVDEINQGMDSRNERIVHKAMVENACAENTSQYFLITPKLLTGLHYHEKMRIHCVMAGSWIPNPSEDPRMIHFGETSNYSFD
ncbi:hypothetical protein SMKI_15G1280 [Saccharomyces mikatae IFO 1815]|uniref:Structural maintenance of chromosomes protein 5 n=1 Tax=Saccharomyces mikatae IFO 1815 TaxID=226126 RepID=A0AA35IUT6_SACMI|nr:uncharacterized protein SMKI_15G1280 [Saccharomyces mikatae IFO 1815]CAI4036289.1 hypothetical protein SMKI_15G1280 [Saccharomyces mikatae IFO 1815]